MVRPIAGLIAVSPLMLGFLFLSYTQSLGVQFCVTSLTVLLWHVAICLVDIVIVAISDFDGTNIAGMIWDAVEKRVAA